MLSNLYERSQAERLRSRLAEPRRFIQVVAGPRQVGKTTLVQQALGGSPWPAVYASADEPTLFDRTWIEQQWTRARLAAASAGGAVLALDEVHKIVGWSETIKRLWDDDTWNGAQVQVLALGSAPLLLQHGLTESLAGRFELIRVPHWSYPEMQAAFGWSLDTYLFYGGYPGAATLIDDPARWATYIRDAIIEPTIARDVLLLARVDKPALLRRLFDLACAYSGQVLSYQKMVGQLQDAGNTTTLAHYLDLLHAAGMLVGLQKFGRGVVRQRGSSPKLLVLNTALVSARSGFTLPSARANPDWWGHLVESAVGAHLANTLEPGQSDLTYWRERNQEVDYVVRVGGRLTGLEVKSGRAPLMPPGMSAFRAQHHPDRVLLIGTGGIPLEEFFARPAGHWVT